MIAYFPRIYEDELVYSWFSRYASKSPYQQYISVAEELYKNPLIRPDFDFINELSEDATKVISNIIGMEDLVMEHTMFKYYSRFLPTERLNKAKTSILKMDIRCKNHMAIRINMGESRHLRYCPTCVKEDRKLYSETYWHTIHQFPEIKICPIHYCYLNKSEIICSGKVSPRLISADSVIGEELKESTCENILERELATYVMASYKSPMVFDNKRNVGAFLHSKLAGTKYCSIRGERRNIKDLLFDVNTFYQDIDEIFIRAQLEKIFTNQRFNAYEICKIAFMLGIPVQELSRMELPSKSCIEEFDEKVMLMHESGKGFNKIAKELGVSSRTVRGIFEEKKGKGYKLYKNKPGVKCKDWDAIDNETLPFVKEIVIEEYEQGDRRPTRITCSYICGKLGKHTKYLDKMPKCKLFVLENQETMEEYWWREIIWTTKYLKRNGVDVNWRRIREITNLSKQNYIKAIRFYIGQVSNESIVKSELEKLGIPYIGH